MKITKEWLEEIYASDTDISWVLSQQETDAATLLRKLTAEGKTDFAFRLVAKLAERKQLVQIAIYAAELTLPVIAEKHPDDQRPHEAIAAARACLEHPCASTRKACRDSYSALFPQDLYVSGGYACRLPDSPFCACRLSVSASRI